MSTRGFAALLALLLGAAAGCGSAEGAAVARKPVANTQAVKARAALAAREASARAAVRAAAQVAKRRERRRDRIGFPAHCPYFYPATDGYPSDSASRETDAVLRGVHSHCFAVLGSRSDDTTLPGGRRIVVGVHWPTADAKGQRLFFFEHDRLVGTDTTGDYLPMVVNAYRTGPTSFTAAYWGVGTHPGAAAMPSGKLNVRFIWNAGQAPRALDQLPTESYPN